MPKMKSNSRPTLIPTTTVHDQDTVRVGVAEIGSRAVRFLIADVSTAIGLKPLFAHSIKTDLIAGIQSGEIHETLISIERELSVFRQRASDLGVRRLAIIGTEAVRQLGARKDTRSLAILKEVEVLDERGEAYCSFVAAARGLPLPPSTTKDLLVIDQGAGSIEVAIGRAEPSIGMTDSVSLKLGGDRLLRQFETNGRDLKKLAAWMRPQIKLLSLNIGADPRTIIQGSAATSFAWRLVPREKKQKYRPALVHGRRVSRQELQTSLLELVGLPVSQWSPWRRSVDPNNPDSDQLERTLTGLVALSVLLTHLRIREFTVSADGTRHGMAWKLAADTVQVASEGSSYALGTKCV